MNLDSLWPWRLYWRRSVDSDPSTTNSITLFRQPASIAQHQRHVPMLLVTALVLSRLDLCNSVLVGLPVGLIQRLQSVQNAAARLIYGTRRSEHIRDALISLHWLHVQERIVFKTAVPMYLVLHCTRRHTWRRNLPVSSMCIAWVELFNDAL